MTYDQERFLNQQIAELRAEVGKLQSLVPHPGDGSCDACGVAPCTPLTVNLCEHCTDAWGELRAENEQLQQRADRLYGWLEDIMQHASCDDCYAERKVIQAIAEDAAMSKEAHNGQDER